MNMFIGTLNPADSAMVVMEYADGSSENSVTFFVGYDIELLAMDWMTADE